MRTIKQIVSQVDNLIWQLNIVKDECILRNCRLYIRPRVKFAIAVTKDKKYVISTDHFGGFNGFDGYLLDSYNTSVYTLADYMVDMKLLTIEESEAFCNHVSRSSQKSEESRKIKSAIELLSKSGYVVNK